MVGSFVSNLDFFVDSHCGPYSVAFEVGVLERLSMDSGSGQAFLIDAKVASLYADELAPILGGGRAVIVEATEAAKSLDSMTAHVEALVATGLRRGDVLVAVGGGVIQDIACFIAATLYRGIPWRFIPTTLVAQADSCIGSKSSINVGRTKNLMGTFTPPTNVQIDVGLLRTLEESEVRSGIGEMLKVHAIKSPASFDRIAEAYDSLLVRGDVLRDFIHDSLMIKKAIVEEDEFDQSIRNIMNYGHSFGHAIEAATDYGIPHGIAITIGMDIANCVARDRGLATAAFRDRMAPTLRRNAGDLVDSTIEPGNLLATLARDKKNTATELRLILPNMNGAIVLVAVSADEDFRNSVHRYMREGILA